MTIIVRPEDAEWISRAIQAGAYRPPDEVVGRAIEVLRSEEGWLEEIESEINSRLDRAFAQFDSGEYFSPDQSRADMKRRQAEWTQNRA